MQYVSVEDRIYTAGFVDGEGCISITKMTKSKHGKSPYHHFFFSLESTDPDITYWLQERFGGSISIDKTKVSHNHRVTYRWKLGTQETVSLLRQLMPYLRVKRPQAELGLLFLLQRNTQRKGRPRGVSAEELALREEFYLQMSALNHAP